MPPRKLTPMRPALVGAILVACSGIGHPPAARAQAMAWPACYALDVGPWSGPFPSESPAEHQPPAIVRFDTAAVDAASGAAFAAAGYRRMTPNLSVFAGMRGRRPQPAWRAVGRDSLEAFWSSGFAGVRMRAVVRGDSLRGVVAAFHDVGGVVQPTASVAGVRVACSGALAG